MKHIDSSQIVAGGVFLLFGAFVVALGSCATLHNSDNSIHKSKVENSHVAPTAVSENWKPEACDLHSIWYMNMDNGAHYMGYGGERDGDFTPEQNAKAFSAEIKTWSSECQEKALTKVRESCDDFLIKIAVDGIPSKVVQNVYANTAENYRSCKRVEADRNKAMKENLARLDREDKARDIERKKEEKRCSGATIMNTCCDNFCNSGSNMQSCLTRFYSSGCSAAADIVMTCSCY